MTWLPVRPVQLLAGLVVALLSVLVLAGPASAHAQLLGTTPEHGVRSASSPPELEIRFNEPVRGSSDNVRVLANDGAPQPVEVAFQGERVVVRTADTLPDGGYVLTWAVVSVDGHVVRGAVSFAVGAGAQVPESSVPDGSGPGWLRGAGGAPIFLAAVALLPGGVWRRRVALTGAALSLAAVGTRLLLLAGELSLVTALATGEGRALVLVLVASALLGAAALVPTGRRALLVTGTAAYAATGLVAGHALVAGPLWALVHAGHLAAALVWTGGVVALLVEPDLTQARAFGRRALSCLAVLALAGPAQAWTLGWRPGGASPWEQTLSLKLALISAALVLGGLHHVLLRRRESPRLRPGLALEAALLLTVAVVSAGLLLHPAPLLADGEHANGHTAAPVSRELVFSDGRVALLVFDAPVAGHSGAVRLELDGDHGMGAELELRSPQSGIGTIHLPLDSADDHLVNRIDWPTPGEWEVVVALRVDRLTSLRAQTVVEVSTAP